MTGGEVETGT